MNIGNDSIKKYITDGEEQITNTPVGSHDSFVQLLLDKDK